MYSRPTRPTSNRDIISAVREYLRGEAQLKDIADKYGVRPPTVLYWVETRGDKVRRSYRVKYKGPSLRRGGKRRRGMRQALVPNARDRQIIRRVREVTYEVAATEFNLTRQRIGAIVHTWKARGWVEPPSFKEGQHIEWRGDTYLVLKVYSENKGMVRHLASGQEIDSFEFYSREHKARLLPDKAAA